MNGHTILRVTDLHFSYGRKSILRGINLTLARGDVTGVVGPNGAGKTTLLRLISGHLRPKQGEVEVMGHKLDCLSPKDKARLIAFVPQNPTTPEGFTTMETVLMGRNPHIGLFDWERKRDLEASQKAMAITNTWDMAHRQMSSLSAGELQRVFVGRALAQESPVLLLDEPTANLDLAHQGDVMNTICLVQREIEGAVLVAMHDLTLASQYCNRLVMLSGGTILTEGSPEQVLTPNNIQMAYGVEVAMTSHPISGTPVVLPTAMPKGKVYGKAEANTHGYSADKANI